MEFTVQLGQHVLYNDPAINNKDQLQTHQGPHPALPQAGHKASMYLSPNYSLKETSASRKAAGPSKQLWGNNWDWDMCLLYGQPAVMLDVSRPYPVSSSGSSSNTSGSCQVTCLQNSCQVRTGGTMGSCFLPPFPTKCSGLPSGCGSCVKECSKKWENDYLWSYQCNKLNFWFNNYHNMEIYSLLNLLYARVCNNWDSQFYLPLVTCSSLHGNKIT